MIPVENILWLKVLFKCSRCVLWSGEGSFIMGSKDKFTRNMEHLSRAQVPLSSGVLFSTLSEELTMITSTTDGDKRNMEHPFKAQVPLSSKVLFIFYVYGNLGKCVYGSFKM